jgi:hypothetical protein
MALMRIIAPSMAFVACVLKKPPVLVRWRADDAGIDRSSGVLHSSDVAEMVELPFLPDVDEETATGEAERMDAVNASNELDETLGQSSRKRRRGQLTSTATSSSKYSSLLLHRHVPSTNRSVQVNGRLCACGHV